MEVISRGVWEKVGDGTFIGEFGAFCDCPVPFWFPNGEIKSGVSGFDKLGADTNAIVSGEGMN